MKSLPKVLEREPLVDAVFEVRLTGTPQMADILPGVLFEALEPRPGIERLPADNILRQIRDNSPELKFAPLVRLDLGGYYVSFGDSNLVINCKLPYQKWPSFRTMILEVCKLIARTGIEGTVERYALKYVNIIPAASISDQIAKINLSVRVGDIDVLDDHFRILVHKKEKETLHLVSVATGAQADVPLVGPVSGVVVDIDSIRLVNFPTFRGFCDALDANLQSLREENKKKFFACLSDDAISEMGPKYE